MDRPAIHQTLGALSLVHGLSLKMPCQPHVLSFHDSDLALGFLLSPYILLSWFLIFIEYLLRTSVLHVVHGASYYIVIAILPQVLSI